MKTKQKCITVLLLLFSSSVALADITRSATVQMQNGYNFLTSPQPAFTYNCNQGPQPDPQKGLYGAPSFNNQTNSGFTFSVPGPYSGSGYYNKPKCNPYYFTATMTFAVQHGTKKSEICTINTGMRWHPAWIFSYFCYDDLSKPSCSGGSSIYQCDDTTWAVGDNQTEACGVPAG